MLPISPRITRTLAFLPVAVACVTLLGWQFRNPLLRGDLVGTFVAPNTALCFIVCGISIVCQVSDSVVWRRIGVALGALVTLFALATIAEYVFRIDLGIDRIFFAHRLSAWNLALPGRFALNTALAFTCAGISLVTLHRREAPGIAEFCAGLVLAIFYLAMVGRAYSASLLYGKVMSPYVAALFGVLGLALLCAARRHIFLDTARSREIGGVVFRRMLVAVLVLLPLIAYVRMQLERRGVMNADVSTPVFVVFSVSVFTVLTLRTAAVVNQIDERRQQTEQALIRTEKLAAAGRMAATVAHEINNPLEAVTNLLFLLKNTEVDAALGREYIRLAEQELARVAAITRRTLGFYKDETKAGDVDLRRVTDGVLELYAHKFSGSAIELKRSYAEGALVRAPEGELRQIITNLLSNAIDALPEEQPRIEITIERADRHVVLTFADNGRGIAEAHLERIFEPFFTTKRDVGNGLGLWVTKALVEKNGGVIEVTTSTAEADHGTTFRLTFPVSTGKRTPVALSANRARATD
jgi:signal transduction histidine kinase